METSNSTEIIKTAVTNAVNAALKKHSNNLTKHPAFFWILATFVFIFLMVGVTSFFENHTYGRKIYFIMEKQQDPEVRAFFFKEIVQLSFYSWHKMDFEGCLKADELQKLQELREARAVEKARIEGEIEVQVGWWFEHKTVKRNKCEFD